MKRKLFVLLGVACLAFMVTAASVPDGEIEAAGTATIRVGLAVPELVVWTVAPTSAQVSVQFKYGSGNLGGAIEVAAGDIKSWAVFCDSMLITPSSSTGVAWYIDRPMP